MFVAKVRSRDRLFLIIGEKVRSQLAVGSGFTLEP